MDPYEQYLADAAYEDYLNKAQQEDSAKAPPSYQLGPDYNQSIGSNAIRGVTQTPQAVIQMGSDALNFASHPIQTVENAGAEKTLENVGGFSAGVAGAGALAPWGAGWGATLGPFGALAGGALAGGAGFAGGLLGFNVLSDAASPGGIDNVKDPEQLAKDFAYNTSQGAILAGAHGATFGGPEIPGKTVPRGFQGPPEAPTAGFPGLVPSVYGAIKRPFTKEGAAGRVDEYLNQLEPGYADKIDTALAEGDGNSFIDKRSLGELIGSDALKAEQRALIRGPNAPGSKLEGTPYSRSEDLNLTRNDKQLRFLDEIAPSDVTAQDTQNAIQENVRRGIDESQSVVDAYQGNVNDALSNLPPTIDPLVGGAKGRSGVVEGLDAQKGRVQAGFTGIGEGVVNPTPVQEILAKELPNYFKDTGQQANESLVKLKKQFYREDVPLETPDAKPLLYGADGQPITKEAAPYTMQDMQALRSEAIKAAKSNDRRSNAIANAIKKAIDATVDNAVKAGSVTAEEAAAWKTGIGERAKQGQVYETQGTPAKAVLKRDPNSGQYVLPDEAVLPEFFKPETSGRTGRTGARAAAKNYKEAYADSPEAMDLLHRYAADSFRKQAVIDGRVNNAAARKWIENHSEALKELPELRAQLSDVTNRQAFLNEKFGDLKRTQAEDQNGALKVWLDGVTPEAAIEKMLSKEGLAKKHLDSTVQYLKGKSPDALGGLRRGVIDYLKRKAFIEGEGGGLINEALITGDRFKGNVLGGTLANEIRRIRPALERSKLFNESQLKGFDDLYTEKRSQLSVDNAKARGGSDTVQLGSTLKAMLGWVGQKFLNIPIVGQPTKYLVSIVAPILQRIPEKLFRETLEEVLFNPRIARDLQNKATSKNITNMAQTIFKTEFDRALGTVAPNIPTMERKEKKPTFPKQHEVTSRKSFPDPKELLSPKAPGNKGVKFDLSKYSPETKARVGVESSGNPEALSPKGAVGLAQLMPDAAEEMSQQLGEPYYPIKPDMTDLQKEISADQNVRFGDAYYQKQLNKYKNRTLAWAAYNSGPQRVDEAIKLAGSSRDINKIMSNLPKESQAYVKKIPEAMQIAQRYGRG